MPGHSLAQLRTSNLRAITALLGSGGPQSRADLARGSGLSRTTVSSLVAELLEGGVVVETDDRGTPYKGGSGRPPLLIALALRPGGVAGVDIGHRHVRVAVSDRGAAIKAEVEAEMDADPHGEGTLDIAAELVRRAAAEAGMPTEPTSSASVCACPDPIDRRSARVDQAVLPGWHELAPADELSRRLDLPVVVDNDANLGAMAEHQHGAARGYADVLYVKLASGVGAGLVLGGRLHRGAVGLAGEVGHVPRPRGRPGLPLRQPRLPGERGVEPTAARAAAAGLRRRPGPRRTCWRSTPPASPPYDGCSPTPGTPPAGSWPCLCTTLNPGVVVIGGSLGASPTLVSAIRIGIDRYAHPEAAASCEVVSGHFGGRAELMGALSLAIIRAAETA